MKILKSLLVSLAFIAAASSAYAVDQSELGKAKELLLENPNIKSLKFDQIKAEHPESQTDKVLQPLLSNPDVVSQDCRYCGLGWVKRPIAEGLVYIDGCLCHVGNYPNSIIVTIFEGPNYGLQLITDYDGIILSTNYVYVIEMAPSGVVFIHEYADCSIVTGLDQIVYFP